MSQSAHSMSDISIGARTDPTGPQVEALGFGTKEATQVIFAHDQEKLSLNEMCDDNNNTNTSRNNNEHNSNDHTMKNNNDNSNKKNHTCDTSTSLSPTGNQFLIPHIQHHEQVVSSTTTTPASFLAHHSDSLEKFQPSFNNECPSLNEECQSLWSGYIGSEAVAKYGNSTFPKPKIRSIFRGDPDVMSFLNQGHLIHQKEIDFILCKAVETLIFDITLQARTLAEVEWENAPNGREPRLTKQHFVKVFENNPHLSPFKFILSSDNFNDDGEDDDDDDDDDGMVEGDDIEDDESIEVNSNSFKRGHPHQLQPDSILIPHPTSTSRSSLKPIKDTNKKPKCGLGSSTTSMTVSPFPSHDLSATRDIKTRKRGVLNKPPDPNHNNGNSMIMRSSNSEVFFHNQNTNTGLLIGNTFVSTDDNHNDNSLHGTNQLPQWQRHPKGNLPNQLPCQFHQPTSNFLPNNHPYQQHPFHPQQIPFHSQQPHQFPPQVLPNTPFSHPTINQPLQNAVHLLHSNQPTSSATPPSMTPATALHPPSLLTNVSFQTSQRFTSSSNPMINTLGVNSSSNPTTITASSAQPTSINSTRDQIHIKQIHNTFVGKVQSTNNRSSIPNTVIFPATTTATSVTTTAHNPTSTGTMTSIGHLNSTNLDAQSTSTHLQPQTLSIKISHTNQLPPAVGLNSCQHLHTQALAGSTSYQQLTSPQPHTLQHGGVSTNVNHHILNNNASPKEACPLKSQVSRMGTAGVDGDSFKMSSLTAHSSTSGMSKPDLNPPNPSSHHDLAPNFLVSNNTLLQPSILQSQVTILHPLNPQLNTSFHKITGPSSAPNEMLLIGGELITHSSQQQEAKSSGVHTSLHIPQNTTSTNINQATMMSTNNTTTFPPHGAPPPSLLFLPQATRRTYSNAFGQQPQTRPSMSVSVPPNGMTISGSTSTHNPFQRSLPPTASADQTSSLLPSQCQDRDKLPLKSIFNQFSLPNVTEGGGHDVLSNIFLPPQTHYPSHDDAFSLSTTIPSCNTRSGDQTLDQDLNNNYKTTNTNNNHNSSSHFDFLPPSLSTRNSARGIITYTDHDSSSR